MCGRYTLISSGDEIARVFDLSDAPDLSSRYNIAPTQEVAAVRAGSGDDGGGRELTLLRWGLVPFWADDPGIGNRMINARSETVASKPAFRSSFKKKRCLVVADGFYEWQKRKGGPKQPWYFRLASGEPFAFAGLWDRWDKGGDDQEPIESCTFATTEPNELVRPVHDRMPVILPREHWDRWLDPEIQDKKALTEMLGPYDPEKMEAWPVARTVNSPGNDRPEVIEPIEIDDAEATRGAQEELF